MGGFLSNVFVQCPDRERARAAVLKVLRSPAQPTLAAHSPELLAQLTSIIGAEGEELARLLSTLGGAAGTAGQGEAYLSPVRDGWIGIHPDQIEIEQLTEGLSAELHSVAIGFTVYDDDFLCYHLARNGQVLDRYNSNPGYFDGEPVDAAAMSADTSLSGDAAILAEACGYPDRAPQIAALLADQEWLGNAFGQLEELATLLGITGVNVTHNDLCDPYPGFELPDQDAYSRLSAADPE